jgi:hypothetical protein
MQTTITSIRVFAKIGWISIFSFLIYRLFFSLIEASEYRNVYFVAVVVFLDIAFDFVFRRRIRKDETIASSSPQKNDK